MDSYISIKICVALVNGLFQVSTKEVIWKRRGVSRALLEAVYMCPRDCSWLSPDMRISLFSSFKYAFGYRSLDSFPSTQSIADGRLENYAGKFKPPTRSMALLDRYSHANTSHERCQEWVWSANAAVWWHRMDYGFMKIFEAEIVLNL